MINVVAQIFIKEECIEKATPLFNEIVEETRKETGCIRYDLFTDSKDKNNFIFIEEWETPASLDAHMKSNHFTRIMPLLESMQSKANDIKIIESFK